MLESDRELLSLIASDDVQAFQKLYHRYWDQLIKHAYVRLGDVSTCEDLVQDIFVDIWNKRKAIVVHSNVKAYLLTAVKYQVYRVIDRRQQSCDLESSGLAEHMQDESDLLSFEELYHRIEVVVEKLPPRQREIFKLSRFGNLSTQEIAEKLQLAPQTVHNKIHQSLTFIKAELKHFIFWWGSTLIFYVL
ncbi:MAG: RNA polymerase sigma-70 factor [Lunatimonas sp.]|uniref:RNA polymerase sigma factor n=1 Tax=Lunatimonas sp. TaxID=2060141 RepID=UPI00263AA816|nr:RNA polymerase sigma-70 factor [Lunatimonas sp.]MCC5936818.1 RNA polymerase sigma-70 factor [Lunatimonas sp.]